MTTYSTDSEGKFIPASQRPDGTWRKARRVRDGYVPQEEVPLYKSKGKEFAQRKTGLPPGMCPLVAEATRKEREKQERAKAKKEAAALAATAALTAAIEAPAKAAIKKQQQQNPSGSVGLPTKTSKINSSAVATLLSPSQTKSAVASSSRTSDPLMDNLTNGIAMNLKLDDDATGDIGKQLKKLRKKVREIESIEERLKSGDIKKPEKDQLAKVKRKKEIIREIEKLEKQLQHQEDGQTAASASAASTSAT